MDISTCVTPEGRFLVGLQSPSFTVKNLRKGKNLESLGGVPDGVSITNAANFPSKDIQAVSTKTIYEIPNMFPFRGRTYIDSSWADAKAEDPSRIRLAPPARVSMSDSLRKWARIHHWTEESTMDLFLQLPRPVLLSLATTSTDPEDLIRLAGLSCEFIFGKDGKTPEGVRFQQDAMGGYSPLILDNELYEAVANNPCLPDPWKVVMVLRPGIQGKSEIVGDVAPRENNPHVFEYLRTNSYIPWGHYAANFAHDHIRYNGGALDAADIQGLRHLYYQRTFVRIAGEMGLEIPDKTLSPDGLEELRNAILLASRENPARFANLSFSAGLWGWNYGFDFAPTGYRLNASHQQIHQQYALIPASTQVSEACGLPATSMGTYCCGDLIAEFCREYRLKTGHNFFHDLTRCVKANTRTDGRDGPKSLVIYEDDNVVLFVPKAQTSQWELQLMAKEEVGNLLEANTSCRMSLDHAMLLAVRAVTHMGAQLMVTIEYSKRFTDERRDQCLLYSFLPKLPYSPGSFSEAQLRFICGHYPEDFAQACRSSLMEQNLLTGNETG